MNLATGYHLGLTRLGHTVSRTEFGAWEIRGNPNRLAYSPGGVGYISEEDHQEAEAFARAWEAENTVQGPLVETLGEQEWRRMREIHPNLSRSELIEVMRCKSCGCLGCASRFDCSRVPRSDWKNCYGY